MSRERETSDATHQVIGQGETKLDTTSDADNYKLKEETDRHKTKHEAKIRHGQFQNKTEKQIETDQKTQEHRAVRAKCDNMIEELEAPYPFQLLYCIFLL